MGAFANGFSNTPRAERVDFRAVSVAALASLNVIAEHYLPRGYRKGREWVALNPTRADARPGSFSLNLDKGIWADFAVDQKGGDAIDLVAYLTGQSKLEAARELQRLLNVTPSEGSTSLTGNVRPAPIRRSTTVAASPIQSRTAPKTFPARTTPDADGKPRFVVADDEGPRVRKNEKRRHIYSQGGVPVRIKIIRDDGDAFNVFRVSEGDVTGWQYRKPEGFEATPYFMGDCPLAADGVIYWPEGERDCETLAKLGLPAITFGGTGDGLPDGATVYFSGRAVIVLSDNDDAGRKHADDKAAALYGVAASIHIIYFPDTSEKGDVSDWIFAGHTVEDLKARVAETPEWRPAPSPAADDNPLDEQPEPDADQKASSQEGSEDFDHGQDPQKSG